MKIVNVYNGDFINSSQGGGMRYLRDLIQAQHRKGYEIELLAVGTGATRRIEIGGVPVTYVPISPTLRWPAFLWRLLQYLMKNSKAYRDQVIHMHRVYFSPAFRMLVKNAHIVVTIHTKTFAVLTERFPAAERVLPALIWLENILLRSCVDRLSAAGEYAVQLYSERHGFSRQTIVPLCGPSLMRCEEVPEPSLVGDERKNILCVGRIASVKRPLAVLELFRRAVDLSPELKATHRLVFVGDGDDRPLLEQSITQHGMESHVKVFGSVEADRMPGIYAAGSCLVLLSSSETGPFTVKEALASGLPVFSTQVGNVVEYVPPACGVVIPVENPETQAEALVRFLKQDFASYSCKQRAKEIFIKEQTQYEQGLDALYNKAPVN